MIWNLDLTDLTKGRVRIETLDGNRREGKITNIVMRSKTLLGKTIEEPEGVVVNGENLDSIDWHLIKSIERIPTVG